MIAAIEASKFLLTLDDPDDGDLTSNLKLQKLLYYSQGFHLALYNESLFPEPIEAWQHGPVCPVVYRHFKQYDGGAIPMPEGFDPSSIPEQARGVLKEVHRAYGQFSAWRLRELTHKEPPWANHYRPEARGIVIPIEEMKTFFDTLVDRVP